MELAVNIPEQEPHPGQAVSSKQPSSSSVMVTYSTVGPGVGVGPMATAVAATEASIVACTAVCALAVAEMAASMVACASGVEVGEVVALVLHARVAVSMTTMISMKVIAFFIRVLLWG